MTRTTYKFTWLDSSGVEHVTCIEDDSQAAAVFSAGLGAMMSFGRAVIRFDEMEVIICEVEDRPI